MTGDADRAADSRAGAPDTAYEKAGATLADSFAATVSGADVIAKVQRPSPEEIALLPEGAVLIALLQPAAQRATLEALAARRITALSMELVPRITRAQSMDVLSSQATVAGYRAVLLGAAELTRLLPMLTTAAGTLAPSRVFVLGAGVAGLKGRSPPPADWAPSCPRSTSASRSKSRSRVSEPPSSKRRLGDAKSTLTKVVNEMKAV